MSRFSQTACALLLLIAIPSATSAQQRGGGGNGRAATPPAARTAPVTRSVPQTRTAAPPAGGFNFNRDINPMPVQRRVAPQPPVTPPQFIAPRRPAVQQPVTPQAPRGRVAPGPINYRRVPSTPNASGGPLQGRFHGPVVRNTHAPPRAWGWNHGVVWRSAPVYWGGGFWGPFALAALTDSLLFGSIVDDQNQVIYPSYQAEPDSPGAQLLQDYGLQQTDCGPPDLVVIWGPDNSVICAFPNDTVAPGNYDVDPSTFSLVSGSP